MKGKNHIPRELSASEDTFENQDEYNYSDNSHDFNVTLSMDSLPSSQSAQQETLISSSNNLTFTERNLHFWKLMDGYTLSRVAMRNLLEII